MKFLKLHDIDKVDGRIAVRIDLVTDVSEPGGRTHVYLGGETHYVVRESFDDVMRQLGEEVRA